MLIHKLTSACRRASGCLIICLVLAVVSGTPAQSARADIRTLIPIALGSQEKVSLEASFLPYRLGSTSTISFGFRVKSPRHTAPQALIGFALSLPKGIGAGTAQLGLATCTATVFYDRGIYGCPPDSFVGRATAIAVEPIGLEIIEEEVQIGVFATTSQSGRLEILYGAEGLTPLFEMLAFHGEILEAKAPYGEEIVTFIPPIETLPEAPYASVVTMDGTIGPKHLTYYKRVHGRRVAFQPEGIELPMRCPGGGFKFAATFTFLDSASKVAHTVVPCPKPRRGA